MLFPRQGWAASALALTACQTYAQEAGTEDAVYAYDNVLPHIEYPWEAQEGTGQAAQPHCYRKVCTLDPNLGEAECFTVDPDTGIFLDVGSQGGRFDHIQRVNAVAVPGLWDGHGHLAQYGEFLHTVDLFDVDSPQDLRDRVKKYVREHGSKIGTADKWIRGVGWDQGVIGRMPTADDFEQDPELQGLYIMLDRSDVHCALVSNAVLNLLPPDLPDEIEGGLIVTDPGRGVFCDKAMDIITPLRPKPTRTDLVAEVKTAIQALHKVGIVGMHDAGARPNTIQLYEELASADPDWTLKVYAMIECVERNTFCAEQVPQFTRPDGKLSVRSVKLFADGALGSWGSAMLEPYADSPNTNGSLLLSPEDLRDVALQWAQAGYQVNIHAIGDYANRLAIDALENALRHTCPDTETTAQLRECQMNLKRHRIEHAQIIHPDDQVRMRDLGIIPSLQPSHAVADAPIAEERLGKERYETYGYRHGSLRANLPIIGSDFPVTPPSPLRDILAAASYNRDHNAADGERPFKREAVTQMQALAGITVHPAAGSFLEHKAGRIRPGNWGDWVVIDKDAFTQDLIDDPDAVMDQFDDRHILETWVNGKMVYQRTKPEAVVQEDRKGPETSISGA